MEEVLKNLMVVEWVAHALHYETIGNEFYAVHLLADRIKDFGSDADDIKEKYYLGTLLSTPPRDVDIATGAKEKFDQIGSNPDLLAMAREALRTLIDSVETAKKESNIMAGVHAVLDDISSRALTYLFLVTNQSTGL